MEKQREAQHHVAVLPDGRELAYLTVGTPPTDAVQRARLVVAQALLKKAARKEQTA